MSELAHLLQTAGMELVASRYMPSEPALERDTFSGGINISARARNHKTLAEACKVYEVASMPRKLFCAPWVYDLLLAGLGADADDRIDAMYASQWELELAGGKGSRGSVAMVWKIQVAEKLRAGSMSRHFWKRNPRPDVAYVDDTVLSGEELAR